MFLNFLVCLDHDQIRELKMNYEKGGFDMGMQNKNC